MAIKAFASNGALPPSSSFSYTNSILPLLPAQFTIISPYSFNVGTGI